MRRTGSVLLLAVFGTPLNAQVDSAALPDASTPSATHSTVTPGIISPVARGVAARTHYTLGEDEWARYETLMAGPHGQWSATLHPLMVLGIEASTTEERERLAARYADIVHARTIKTTAFALAYQTAYTQRYGAIADAAFGAGTAPAMSSADRYALFVSTECGRACDDKLEEILFALDRDEAAGLDIYVSNAPDDGGIRAWATHRGIPPDAVAAGTVTLNHTGDVLTSLALGDTPLPVVLKHADATDSELGFSPVPSP